MKHAIMLVLSFAAIHYGSGQTVNKDLLEKRWNASWIAVPNEEPDRYGVYIFRKELKLDARPSRFVVHVSADNRYKLYVNETLVSVGPARGDIDHWNYETVDIASFLRNGKNVISAKVWNEASWRPEAQISMRTGFILQGDSSPERAINTDSSWRCVRDDSYRPIKISLPAYYVSGPGELIHMDKHLRGWQRADFDDSSWKPATEIFKGMPADILGPYGTTEGWLLTPSKIPALEVRQQRFASLRWAKGIDVAPTFPAAKTSITIPANTSVSLLLDQSQLTNAYLKLELSGGRGAGISLMYAEALYSKHPEKGNRNEIDGKYMMGRRDSIVADGTTQQIFTTLYWRTFRYVEIIVHTKEQPLIIEDIYSEFTGYPFRNRSKLNSGVTELNTMLEIGWHTARLCALETYMDCPYYEQLQYIGDTRIQGLVSLYNSGDDRLLRNAIDLADQSRRPEGVTLSRHPSYTPQYIPTFSLWYIGMLYDYWMYGADTVFVKNKLAGARQVLSFFQNYQQEDGSLKSVPHWLFTDWVYEKGWEAGRGPVGADGNSAMLDLQLLWAYQLAAEMEAGMGMNAYANSYRQKAAQLKKTILKKYWDDKKKLFADRSEKDLFSQHTNSLAILTGVVEKEQAAMISRKMLKESGMAKATIYFKYYLHQALIKSGLGNHYLDWLDKWRENIRLGLTTWAEMSEVSESRSDCHAWGSSPNIEFFRTVLGIDTDAPGFMKVKIKPHLGTLKDISGEMPHPLGTIAVKYTFNGNNIKAIIELPKKIAGTFIWKGKNYELKGGRNTFNLD